MRPCLCDGAAAARRQQQVGGLVQQWVNPWTGGTHWDVKFDGGAEAGADGLTVVKTHIIVTSEPPPEAGTRSTWNRTKPPDQGWTHCDWGAQWVPKCNRGAGAVADVDEVFY